MKSPWTPACILMLLGACASTTPDHFYVLSTLPQDARYARPPPTVQATLKLTLPASADRSEILLNASGGRVIVLEHERWAAPLADLARQTLARDLERRRTDMLIFDHEASRSKATDVRIAVEVVHMTLQRGGRARIEAQWRISNVRPDMVVGGGEFSAPLADGDYAAVAQSLSECLGLLADRLVEEMR